MLSSTAQTTLLRLARDSIQHGLSHGEALPVIASEYDAELKIQQACFVTLHIAQQLRGCIGCLTATRPLVIDVTQNAFNAAFRDPRFAPLQNNEFEALHVHIEVLSIPEPIHFDSEQDLLKQIRPGIDGLVLYEGIHRGTFLPSVWESLPTAEQFLNQLKRKAGLTSDHWSNEIRIERYTTEAFEEEN